MLVLSRKKGESIEFAGLDIEIRVVGCSKSKVQLGIEAPRDVVINRSEQLAKRSSPSRPQAVEDSHTPDFSTQILDELARVESELAALCELAGEQDRNVARTVAVDAIARLDAIGRAVRLTAKPKPMERPMIEFLDAPNEQSPADSETPSHWPPSKPTSTTFVRQSNAGYLVA